MAASSGAQSYSSPHYYRATEVTLLSLMGCEKRLFTPLPRRKTLSERAQAVPMDTPRHKRDGQKTRLHGTATVPLSPFGVNAGGACPGPSPYY